MNENLGQCLNRELDIIIAHRRLVCRVIGHDKIRTRRNPAVVQRTHSERRNRGHPQPGAHGHGDPDGQAQHRFPRSRGRGDREDPEGARFRLGLRHRRRQRRGGRLLRPRDPHRRGGQPAVHELLPRPVLQRPLLPRQDGQEARCIPLGPHALLHGPRRGPVRERGAGRPGRDARGDPRHEELHHPPELRRGAQRPGRDPRGHQPRPLRRGQPQARQEQDRLQPQGPHSRSSSTSAGPAT